MEETAVVQACRRIVLIPGSGGNQDSIVGVVLGLQVG